MRTALVLGAGGIVGQAYHLGVLSALQELAAFEGRDADVLVGTSAGSLVAAALAGGLSAQDLAHELVGRPLSPAGQRTRAATRAAPHMPEQPARSARRGPLAPGALLSAARRPWGVRPTALVASLLPAGRHSTEPIARGVRRLHPASWPARDLRLCAVRARDAQRVVFTGPPADIGSAAAASCAIPGWFAPVQVDGETYVDGGAHSPSNADVVLADRPDLVVVVSPMSARRVGDLRVDSGVRLAVGRRLAAEVRRLRRAGSRVVVLQPGPGDLRVMGSNAMRSDHRAAVVERAALSTRHRLECSPGLLP